MTTLMIKVKNQNTLAKVLEKLIDIQGIERVFSKITSRFAKKNHALAEKGFILKMVLFLLAYTFEKMY